MKNVGMKKKLQVFVSSTYLDLQSERQAAVQAILDAGHIPAGMELFRAGNDSQMATIKKWIDESDVYMLILGGRYGSIDSVTGKSYTQLEYEYAINKGIPVFAVVLTNSFLHFKAALKQDVFEKDSINQYNDFKNVVMSKLVKYVEDEKDIKLAVLGTLSDFLYEYDFVGWTRNIHEPNINTLSTRKIGCEIETKDNVVFIGSSLEALPEAKNIAITVESNGYKPLLWNDPEVFLAGKNTIDSLELMLSKIDAAIFIFNEDDQLLRRDSVISTVRDNTLFEYGMFCGSLTRNKVCFCCKGNPKIASDLSGITYINLELKYRSDKEISLWLKNIFE